MLFISILSLSVVWVSNVFQQWGWKSFDYKFRFFVLLLFFVFSRGSSVNTKIAFKLVHLFIYACSSTYGNRATRVNMNWHRIECILFDHVLKTKVKIQFSFRNLCNGQPKRKNNQFWSTNIQFWIFMSISRASFVKVFSDKKVRQRKKIPNWEKNYQRRWMNQLEKNCECFLYD